jgi:hypothetical protein
VLALILVTGEQGFGQARVLGSGLAAAGRTGDGLRTNFSIEKREECFRGSPDQGPFGFVDQVGMTRRIPATEAVQSGVSIEWLGPTPIKGACEDDFLEGALLD